MTLHISRCHVGLIITTSRLVIDQPMEHDWIVVCSATRNKVSCRWGSVSNGSSFVPGRFYRSAWQPPYPINNRRFFKRTITLRPQVLIREFSVWYVKYVAPHAASFGPLRFSISSNLSKRYPKNLVFGPKMAIISKQLAEFRRYQKSETTKRGAVQSCILYILNTKLCDE